MSHAEEALCRYCPLSSLVFVIGVRRCCLAPLFIVAVFRRCSLLLAPLLFGAVVGNEIPH